MNCWRLSEPKAGMEVQCLALAETLGVPGERKQVLRRLPWSLLPLRLWRSPLSAPARGSDALLPPWPELLISCGRYAAGVALGIKRAAGPRTFAVHIQDPHVDPARFDLVVVPRHDTLRGPNVMVTRGSLHRVTPQLLAAESHRFAPLVATLPRPLVTVLVGGATARYRFGAREAQALVERLCGLTREYGAGLAVTVSRRTGAEITEVLRHGLRDLPAVLWDGTGENPYFGFLGLAEYILVTCDSVNMTTEACATGKPVFVLDLPGGSRRFRDFHAGLQAEGYTRAFGGCLAEWSHPPLNDNQAVAAEIRRHVPALAAPPPAVVDL